MYNRVIPAEAIMQALFGKFLFKKYFIIEMFDLYSEWILLVLFYESKYNEVLIYMFNLK